VPRCGGAQISTIAPPVATMGALPKTPVKKRARRMVWMVVAEAVVKERAALMA
jgi:hypothetical protein